MAFTCGTHHLVHAYRHLVLREPAHGPMQAAMAIGAVPAVVFIALRLEAAFGGRGDRLVRNRRAFELLPLVLVAAAGATVARPCATLPDGRRLARPAPEHRPVGQLRARRVLHRPHPARPPPPARGWSFSGLAMSGVFLTCAMSHLAAGC